MAITIECTAGELGNNGDRFNFVSPESISAFKELVQRGSNLWPDAPPIIKEFADRITNGVVQQDYYAQANAFRPAVMADGSSMLEEATKMGIMVEDLLQTSAIPLQFKQDPANPRVFHNLQMPGTDAAWLESLPVPYTKFELDVAMFNEMYELSSLRHASREEILERCKNYKTILTNEVNEYDEIIQYLETTSYEGWRLQVMVMLADLMGDIQVYCASEMKRFELPQQQVLDVIMQSNFSKLGEDGKPIKNNLGKVMKGPGYWKPEPKIEALLRDKEAGDLWKGVVKRAMTDEEFRKEYLTAPFQDTDN